MYKIIADFLTQYDCVEAGNFGQAFGQLSKLGFSSDEIEKVFILECQNKSGALDFFNDWPAWTYEGQKYYLFLDWEQNFLTACDLDKYGVFVECFSINYDFMVDIESNLFRLYEMAENVHNNEDEE